MIPASTRARFARFFACAFGAAPGPPAAPAPGAPRVPGAARRRPLALRSAPLLALLLLGAFPRTAAAHQTSMKQLDLRVAERRVELTLRASFDDVATAAGRDPKAISRAELLADPGVLPTVTGWVQLLAGAAPCPPAAAALAEDRDPRFLTVRWRADCPAPTRVLTLELEAFFALDATHTMVLHLEGQGAALDTVIGVDDSPLTVRLSAPPRSFPRWVHLGIEHIFGGADHVCFVIALLLAAVLVRSPDGGTAHRPDGGTAAAGSGSSPSRRAGGRWQLRPARQVLRSVALLITSFSVAHSLTLIAASLGWVELPGRLVETAIAASILYAAAENAFRPDASRRWLLTFGFGLIHGLGFASALHELLPPDRVILPLLAFNLGVELGQLFIVTAALPLLLGLAHVLRPHRYRTRFLPLSSILLGSLALMWSLERAFDLVIW